MSWSVQLTDVDPVVVEEAARERYAAFKASYSDHAEVYQAMDEQFEAALNAARILLVRGTVGGGHVNVSLSGHANPGHKPRQGWANDYVMATVSSAVVTV
jgi:hypothetical protein